MSDTLVPEPHQTANVDLTDATNPLPAMMPPRAYEFPWPEMRDFVSLNISMMMTQQSLMVGEKMLEAGAPNVNEEAIAAVRKQLRMLTEQLQLCNARVEQAVIAFEGKGPRLILPR